MFDTGLRTTGCNFVVTKQTTAMKTRNKPSATHCNACADADGHDNNKSRGHNHSHKDENHGHNHNDHEHHHHHASGLRAFMAPAVSALMLIAGLVMSHCHVAPFATNGWIELAWYIAAFIPVGLPVIKEAVEGIADGDFFNEFTLMTIACIGAFCIRELPEAVGVMLFYSIGETLQHGAVDRAKSNIAKLIDVRGDKARVVRDGKTLTVAPDTVKVGETIEVGPGERVPLDGEIIGASGSFDTSALTGESMPRDIASGEEVLAGMISLQNSVKIRVTREYTQSTLSRILDMVSESASRKAHTELFIRRFARVYTPVVIIAALLVTAVPWLVSLVNPSFHYVFQDWLYRSLVFLVISCPCALVISVPLGYFAGIGAASRRGILIKGGNYLESIARVNIVALDKTGTMTTGTFSVEKAGSTGMSDEEMIALLASAEEGSSHPLAKAVVEYARGLGIAIDKAESMSEKAGYGTIATIGGRRVIAGNLKLMKEEGIELPKEVKDMAGTIIICGVDGRYAGYVLLSDTLKPDAAEAVAQLHELGVTDVVMLSGDREAIVADYAGRLGINEAHGGLLPQDKAEYVEKVASTPGREIAFVGDGMNDAPVLALSDVGVAMGGLGSDAAIESADIVIQTDSPSRVATAIRIGRVTHAIVKENIIGAIGIKVVILGLGALGYASLWAAVFADVGVALLAVLNSLRILHKNYR